MYMDGKKTGEQGASEQAIEKQLTDMKAVSPGESDAVETDIDTIGAAKLSGRTKKKALAAAAVLIAAVLITVGTFAWQSIDQMALNQKEGYANHGGRLHDDFNGKNKDVYVENFSSRDNGGEPIYARVRLDEYMEVTSNGRTEALVPGASKEDTGTWQTHKYGESNAPFGEHWEWHFGGSTVYMPTFKKDRDSLSSDINGTLEGTGSGVAYDDYKTYTAGQSKTATAVYDDADSSQNVTETHVARRTPEARVITMAQWQSATYNKEPGDYWVYDTDGWAYWAKPIEPGQATGLLLSGVENKDSTVRHWYYGINVVGQFASRGDWGDPVAGTGFYQDGGGLTEDAKEFLEIVSATEASISLTNPENYIEPGESKSFTANLIVPGDETPAVKWSVKNNASAATTINGVGLLQAGADEPLGRLITVRAEYSKDSTICIEKKVRVSSAGYEKLEDITPGSMTTTTIDGKNWYVIDKKTRNGQKQALIFCKDYFVSKAFDNDSNRWKGSEMERYLNGAYIAGMPELNATAIETSIYTRTGFNSDDFEETRNRVFLLSEADYKGSVNSRETYAKTAEARDYSNGEGTLKVSIDMIASAEMMFDMTRSPARYGSEDKDMIWFVYGGYTISGIYVGPSRIGTSPGYVDAEMDTYRCRGAMWVPLQS